MNYSKQTLAFADHIVSYYSTYNKLSEQYVLSSGDIADFDIHELCAFIMSDNEDAAYEANSIDNPYYNQLIFPALLKYMRNTADRDGEIEYVKACREGIAAYFDKRIHTLLDERLANHNDFMREVNPCAA